MARRIVKYSNRRLYDPTTGRAITLVELFELVLAGEDVAVELKDTGADITTVTVLQSVIERLRQGRGRELDARVAERVLNAVRGAVSASSEAAVPAGAADRAEGV